MQPLLVFLLLLLLQGDPRHKKLAEQVVIGPVAASKVTGMLSDRARWAAGFKVVEEKLGGRFDDATAVELTWDYDGAEFVKMSGDLKIRFNLAKLEAYQKKLDELEERDRELAREGKRMVYRLPPAKLERFIPHELTHVLQKQRQVQAPEWFEEGLAQWVGDDPNVLIGYALSGKKFGSIDDLLPDPDDVYARGHLFFKWLDSKGAVRKAVQPAFFDGVAWQKAIEDAVGLKWDAIAAAEQAWSARELEKLRPPAK